MQQRPLGQHGLSLSVIGFGGIVVSGVEPDVAEREVAAAVDRGVTYFDVAPTYGDAQQKLGPALEPYRDGVALACKTTQRRADKAAAELDDSLRKLRTDRFDIYQLHGVTTLDEVDTVLGPGGAMEAVLAARDAGKVRLVGFSAHGEEAALRLIGTGLFDTMLYPLNAVPFEAGRFGPAALDAATARGMGVMALKAMARGRIDEGDERSYKKCWYHPEDRPEIAHLLLRYTLNLPGADGAPGVSAVIPPGDPGLFHLALDLAERGLDPLDDAERDALFEAVGGHTAIFPAPA